MEAETLQVRDVPEERLETMAIYVFWQPKLSSGQKSVSRTREDYVGRRECRLALKVPCERSLLGIEPEQDPTPVTDTTHRLHVFDGLPKQSNALLEDQRVIGLAVCLQINIGTGDVAVKRTIEPHGSSCGHPARKTDAHQQIVIDAERHSLRGC